jgi:ectoine hydroxylase-related dioxygenase (phytanoyl-CoA dioxygenase family)
VHGSWTVHSAPANTTDDPRWSLMMILFPADAVYQQEHRVVAGLGLELRGGFDHPDFPTVYEPSA